MMSTDDAMVRAAKMAHRTNGRKYAGTDCVAVEMHRASTTLAESAAEARAVQADIVAQRVQERHRWIVDGDAGGTAVDIERDGLP